LGLQDDYDIEEGYKVMGAAIDAIPRHGGRVA
jgi:hypothetical protein